MAKLTDRAVTAAITKASKKGIDIWLTEGLGRGSGTLVLKATPRSAYWYYRYTSRGKTDILPIAPYGSNGADNCKSLKDARANASEWAHVRRSIPGGDLRAHFERIEAEEAARREAEERAKQASEEADKHTLTALVQAYTAHLEQQGKTTSAGDARRLIERHILKPHPEVADAPARDLTRQQATEALRRIVEAGKGRTAGKVRSYLRAAYALALRAESDPAAPSSMIGFNIDTNPIADTDTVSLRKFNRARDRALSEPELRAFWKRLQREEGAAADALTVVLLAGGQRTTQLLRATLSDLDVDAGTVTLYDPKGKREQPRPHLVPLPDKALEVMERRAELARSLDVKWLFTSTGKKPTVMNTVSVLVADIAEAMVKAEEAEPFNLSDIRRTVETHMARMGVSKDIRAQIQSHGLSGIQTRHYDKYDYLAEKRTAITAWADWLVGNANDNIVFLNTGK